MSIVFLGLATTLVAEAITYINAHLTGTVLSGRGALILTVVVSLVAGTVHTLTATGFHFVDWQSIVVSFSAIWAFSQAFFEWFIKKFSLDVQA